MRSKETDQYLPLGQWFKSSYSGSHGECVEVANQVAGASVRDTQNRNLGTLAFDSAEWRAFLSTAKRDTP